MTDRLNKWIYGGTASWPPHSEIYRSYYARSRHYDNTFETHVSSTSDGVGVCVLDTTIRNVIYYAMYSAALSILLAAMCKLVVDFRRRGF